MRKSPWAFSAISSIVPIGLAGLLSACTQPNEKPSVYEKPAEVSIADNFSKPAAPYHIGVGDEVEIKFFFAPELNEQVQVRPDGKISIMFAADIQAAGHTPEELADIIKEKLAEHVKQSDLVVIMRSFTSQRVYISGEVAKPGPVQLAGGERLMQILTDAGWITPNGRSNEVMLIRCCNEKGGEMVYNANVDKIASGEDMSQNIFVQAGDQIFVPPSDIVAFDRWIDQHIRQALPFSTNVSAVYSNQNSYRP